MKMLRRLNSQRRMRHTWRSRKMGATGGFVGASVYNRGRFSVKDGGNNEGLILFSHSSVGNVAEVESLKEF